jgi:hypothetical protein
LRLKNATTGVVALQTTVVALQTTVVALQTTVVALQTTANCVRSVANRTLMECEVSRLRGLKIATTGVTYAALSAGCTPGDRRWVTHQ